MHPTSGRCPSRPETLEASSRRCTMNARTMNPKAVVAAAMMMVSAVTVQAASAGLPVGGLGSAVPTRTVLKYGNSAWTSPVAVVLKSAADWTAWNQNMVARGMAINVEAVPAGVDWNIDALLVVALGGGPNVRYGVDLTSVERVGLDTEVTLSVAYGQGGSYPCVV